MRFLHFTRLDLLRAAQLSLAQFSLPYPTPPNPTAPDPTWPDRNSNAPVAAGGGGTGAGHRPEPGWYADPGDYEVRLGASSADLRAVLHVHLDGDEGRRR